MRAFEMDLVHSLGRFIFFALIIVAEMRSKKVTTCHLLVLA